MNESGYDAHIHPSVRKTIADNHVDIVREVQAAIATNDVVVVSMKQNPVPKKAHKALEAEDIPYLYREYGSYLGGSRRRNALKMWTGWPTFPMVFVEGVFVGGAADLGRLIANGEIKAMLHAKRPKNTGRR